MRHKATVLMDGLRIRLKVSAQRAASFRPDAKQPHGVDKKPEAVGVIVHAVNPSGYRKMEHAVPADARQNHRSFRLWVAVLASPLFTMFREVHEMRYLWRQPLQLDNRKLVALLGAEPHTALDEAIDKTLRGMGCIYGTVKAA